ncbi:MAG TPA: rhomboid family intramembrane serine protease [Bradyrhizobium sp.]|nr:rhomboid family intramembrane serine protease [Bradyrhizobium sp.]
MAYRDSQSFFAAPQAAVYLLLTVNILVFALCLKLAGTPELPGALLYRYGAMHAFALPRQEYWRLIAYGFLHSNLVHLLTNMLCLLLWGGQLERRLGWTYFVVVYGCALVFGAIIGDAIHAKPYLTVGASGATSGILGALLCLWILGRTDLPGNFFIINIGLNVVLALSIPRIDWGVHAGGFCAGLIACAILDLLEKTLFRLLRCKFPEFAKANLFVLACAAAVLWWGARSAAAIDRMQAVLFAALFALACLVVVKLVDVVLTLRKGLAITVIALAAANAAMVQACATIFVSQLAAGCTNRPPSAVAALDTVLQSLCASPGPAAIGASVLAAVLTVLLYSQEFYRGLIDVGFVATSLQAARHRSRGI